MKDVKEMVVKLLNIEKEIAYNKGSFNLFALFLRDGENKWDLLISSTWIDKEKYESLRYIASIIQRKLTKEELVEISGIEIVDHNDSALNEIYNSINVEHSIVEKTNRDFFGVMIHHAYIITSHNPIRHSLIAA